MRFYRGCRSNPPITVPREENSRLLAQGVAVTVQQIISCHDGFAIRSLITDERSNNEMLLNFGSLRAVVGYRRLRNRAGLMRYTLR